MVIFSSRISPLTSTVIFLDKSPLATAVVTAAMLRTCAVRLPAIELTLSGRVASTCTRQRPLPLLVHRAFLPSTDLASDAGHLTRKRRLSWSTIVLMVFFSSRISPRTSTFDLLG